MVGNTPQKQPLGNRKLSWAKQGGGAAAGLVLIGNVANSIASGT
jgi:hypothetical protein